MAMYRIYPEGASPFTIAVEGRELWALEQLISAGPKGCTPITRPAPRWSAYVHKLRKLHVPIETRYEQHGGPFAGNHARYILKAKAEKQVAA
ncbi:hypothetical protein ACFOHK_06855 [Falsigemmobacter intermedius]|uniref:Winged helix domain-containing protein n=1 Tax=Falsigemmobacter intermedius TaxID=1553448 RepID=A0A3S3UYL2_9RHOB|nr:hypothetical protein [Falsigemmobacter intermedius]RWY38751.1 hypothetical protein EP867_15745 [Falsigemmobacter intermedius]